MSSVGIRLILLLAIVLSVLAGCGAPGLAALPLEVSYRDAKFGNGYVVMIRNTSDKSLRITLTALSKSKTFVLDSGKLEEFGWAEGFKLASKDQITLKAEGYGEHVFSVP